MNQPQLNLDKKATWVNPRWNDDLHSQILSAMKLCKGDKSPVFNEYIDNLTTYYRRISEMEIIHDSIQWNYLMKVKNTNEYKKLAEAQARFEEAKAVVLKMNQIIWAPYRADESTAAAADTIASGTADN